MSTVLVWSITAGSVAGILFRPKAWREAVWACLGALLVVSLGLLPPSQALHAAAKGTDVYLFLTGMMLLSELARQEGVFDWVASRAVSAAQGSGLRLFALVYGAGIVITVFLSNDATAVILTPAVYAALRRTRANALPYLLICAFIANAASFVLPISNPANLVVYGKTIPPLWPWLRMFFVPSLCSIAATYAALRWYCRKEIREAVDDGSEPAPLSREGRRAAWALLASGVVLVAASAFGFNLGTAALLTAAVAILGVVWKRPLAVREIAAGVSWSVLPLVAGLFILVEALDRGGALADAGRLLRSLSGMPAPAGNLAASFGAAAVSNVMNNLPSGLLAGGALRAAAVPAGIHGAVLLGVDLGPNLSVAGSLATVLWLIALRREGLHVSGWQFLKAGALVMPPALLLATLCL